jgi:glutamyl-tRNA synthetase
MIRTRYAPSPTGFQHVGGIRTAFFAYLVARQAKGKFILRLEDTDQKREVAGSDLHLIECLRILGLHYDEGPDIGGPFAPYRQSERLEKYHSWALKLIEEGRAFADPYSPDELNAFREQSKADKKAFLYRDHRPDSPPAWDGKQPLRFKSEPRAYEWHDKVMGDLKAGPEVIDDFILIKSDGYPTYNFAHIVDDAEMKISHVIRSQEFISSMPNYLNLYEAMGIEKPIFATMPPIMNEQGNKKLGKRDGAKDILDYVRDGYLPETLLSFIATLGWNDGTEQEIFTLDELTEKFSLERVQKSGARFDEKRLLWMNGQFVRTLTEEDLFERAKDFIPKSALEHDQAYVRKVLLLVQDRLKTLGDIPTATSYFFEEPTTNTNLISDNKQLSKLSPDERASMLQMTHDALESCTWEAHALQEALNGLLKTTGQKPGILFSLIRIVVTWAPFSPQLNETLALLGRDRVLSRISAALK